MKPLKTTVTAFIFHDDKLLLIKHKKTGKWLHVGGHSEENETPEETLLREVKEEVNLEVRFLEEFDHFEGRSDLGFKQLPRPCYMHSREKEDHRKLCFDYICIAEDISKLKIQESEIDDHKWMSKSDLDQDEEFFGPLKALALKAFGVYENWKKVQN